MRRPYYSQSYFSVPDVMILLLFGAGIYALVQMGNQWRAEFHPFTEIDLSVWALPRYTLFSGIRGGVAYFISLAFTLVSGYCAAKSKTAEKIIIPLLDILQSIPVLGFLPPLVLGLVALFPRSNVGLELATILMIWSSQCWNMAFSFYGSLKSIPSDLIEASTVIGLDWKQRLLRVELPFSAVDLTWNSVFSMAGGWFFLSACEAFTLGEHPFRLPGIGAYMAVAISKGNTQAMVLGVIAMILLIVVMDILIWRPILAWVQKYRIEEVPGTGSTEPLMQIFIRESKILRWIKLLWRKRVQSLERTLRSRDSNSSLIEVELPGRRRRKPQPKWGIPFRTWFQSPVLSKTLLWSFNAIVLILIVWGLTKLFQVLSGVGFSTWVILLRNTIWTLIRVFLAVFLCSLWTVPFGIWIATSRTRLRIAQPLIQIIASFPAPMLYPLALAFFFRIGINFDWGSMFLMMIGVQGYVLFNILAGALRIPQELGYALSLIDVTRWDRWKRLYLPSVFPSLVTGWATATGGAWNASVITEVISYYGKPLETGGLGATINLATSTGNFKMLIAALTVMVAVVVLLNRTFWARLYHIAQSRYKMDF